MKDEQPMMRNPFTGKDYYASELQEGQGTPEQLRKWDAATKQPASEPIGPSILSHDISEATEAAERRTHGLWSRGITFPRNNMKTANEKLKHEISKRWPNVRSLADTTAHAQLEYILQEAGLLTKPRKRKKKETGESGTHWSQPTSAENMPKHVLD
jgi:hypothetical protein